jgi:hypothetical protein
MLIGWWLIKLETAYKAACVASINASIPAAAIALLLPPDWDGPADMVLGTAVTVLAVTTGGILGFAGLYVVSSM